jgi:Fe-S cluster assembly ATP-binding protein
VSAALEVRGLRAGLGELEILAGVDITVPFGEIHALMGPNGSGKSTLCHVLMGKDDYAASGSALLDGVELVGKPVNERAAAGLFTTFQYPVEVAGVMLSDLVEEMSAVTGDDLGERAAAAAARLDMAEFLERPVNQGLSGGEKKRSEIFQLLVRAPKVAVLDEIDSGLDIDAVREVAAAVESMRSPELGVLLITHYSRILRYLSVDGVHIMVAGRIVRSGGSELAEELESKGYDGLRSELGIEVPDEGDAVFDL